MLPNLTIFVFILMPSLIVDKFCAAMNPNNSNSSSNDQTHKIVELQQHDEQQRMRTTAPPTHPMAMPLSDQQQVTSTESSSITDDSPTIADVEPWNNQVPQAQLSEVPMSYFDQIVGQINTDGQTDDCAQFEQMLSSDHQMPEAQFYDMPTGNWDQIAGQIDAQIDQIAQHSLAMPSLAPLEWVDDFFQNDRNGAAQASVPMMAQPLQMPMSGESHQIGEQQKDTVFPHVPVSPQEWLQMFAQYTEEEGYHGQCQNDENDTKPMQMQMGGEWHPTAAGHTGVMPSFEEWQQIIGQKDAIQTFVPTPMDQQLYYSGGAGGEGGANLTEKAQPELEMDAFMSDKTTLISPNTWAALMTSIGSPTVGGQNVPLKDTTAGTLYFDHPKAAIDNPPGLAQDRPEMHTMTANLSPIQMSPQSWAILIRSLEQMSPLAPTVEMPTKDIQQQKQKETIVIEDDDEDDNEHQTNRSLVVVPNKGKKQVERKPIESARSSSFVPSSAFSAALFGVPPPKIKLPPLPRTIPSSVPAPKQLSPRTAAAFPIARKRRPPVPPLLLPNRPNQSHHHSSAEQRNFLAGQVLARKKMFKNEAGQSSLSAAFGQKQQQRVANDGAQKQQQIGASTSNIHNHQQQRMNQLPSQLQETDANWDKIKAFLMCSVRTVVLITLRLLHIEQPKSFLDESVQQIRNNVPVEMALKQQKLILAQKLKEMNAEEVTAEIRKQLLDHNVLRKNKITPDMFEQIKANCVETFGQTALTDPAAVFEFNECQTVVLFFFSRLFRKLGSFLSAPFTEKREFQGPMKQTYRMALFSWISTMRKQFVKSLKRFTRRIGIALKGQEKPNNLISSVKQLTKFDAIDTNSERFWLAHLAVCSTLTALIGLPIHKLELDKLELLLNKFLKRNFACLVLYKEQDDFISEMIRIVVADQWRLGLSQTLLSVFHSAIARTDQQLKHVVGPLKRRSVNNLAKIFVILVTFLPQHDTNNNLLVNHKLLAHWLQVLHSFVTVAGQQITHLDQHLANAATAAESAKQGGQSANTDDESATNVEIERNAMKDFWLKHCINFTTGNTEI